MGDEEVKLPPITNGATPAADEGGAAEKEAKKDDASEQAAPAPSDPAPAKKEAAPAKKEAPTTIVRDAEKAQVLSAQRLTRDRGLDILRDPFLNKGLAFTERERDMLGIRGLIPPTVTTMEQQLEKLKKEFLEAPSDIARYHILEGVCSRNVTLYYRFLMDNVKISMPIVYTPTVGQACLDFSQYYRSRARGLFFSRHDVEYYKDICMRWPQNEVEIIVITDGSRILGLGDLGINGMGIPIGKLALYVACAGFLPWRTLPITVDFGTDTAKYLECKDEEYIGLKEKRPADEEYHEKIQKVISAIKWRWPKALIQFEDFSNEHAFWLLDRYRNDILCFNDDIQGTACTVLSGLLAALRLQNPDTGLEPGAAAKLRDQRIVFLGAGSAGVGVADLIAEGMVREAEEDGETPKPVDEYRKSNFWLVDTKGVVTTTREGKLQSHKIRFARDDAPIGTLLEAIQTAKPTILIGLAGQPGGSFTEEMIKTMNASCAESGIRPIIMALSNPTSKAECTAKDAYTHTDGNAIFASGSPFDPVTLESGKVCYTGQGNNMYVFPGVGYGAVRCGATSISDKMFYMAAKTLASTVTDEDLKKGSVYPDLGMIREITAKVAASSCKVAESEGVATIPEPAGGWEAHLTQIMWTPKYEEYV